MSIDDVDNLFWPERRPRLTSDTCMSTSNGPSTSSGALTNQRICQPELSSYPEIQSLCDDLITVSGNAEQEQPTNLAPLAFRRMTSLEIDVEQPGQQDIAGVITHLQPISVAAQSSLLPDHHNDKSCANVSSNEQMASHERAPATKRCRQPKESTPANLIQHNVRRKKKTPEQVAYLQELFQRLDGEWDGKVRKEAMRKTGLSRIQIYKWFFDMKL